MHLSRKEMKVEENLNIHLPQNGIKRIEATAAAQPSTRQPSNFLGVKR